MPRKLNLIGQHFERLMVIEETKERDRRGGVIWKCKCDCGNLTTASSSDLRSGHKKSCGCLNKEKIAAIGRNNLKDLTGQTFGVLTVQSKGRTCKTNNGSTKVYWKCLCKCGNTVEVVGNSLKNGTTKSCGCIKSFGEQKIAQLLRENGLQFEKEKTFPDATSDGIHCFRFDFYVDNKYLIEYDGKHHFQQGWKGEDLKVVQDRDKKKNEYCLSHGITLIRIPYTQYQNLSISDLLIETSKFIVAGGVDK